MKKAFRLLIWFFYNLHWAKRIYNEQRIKDVIRQLDTWEYSRKRSEMQKAIDIIRNNYSDASTNAKSFFWKYYLYRVVKGMLIDIGACLLLIILCITGITQIDWNYGKGIAFGVLAISIAGIMFIVITNKCKDIRNIVAEHKSLTLQKIPGWVSAGIFLS